MLFIKYSDALSQLQLGCCLELYLILYYLLALLLLTMSTSIPVQNTLLHTLLPQYPLPPCGSYRDCSSGASRSYNFLPDIQSASSCQGICQSDPQCGFYSYNHSTASPHYRHCYLSRDCVGPVPGQAWLSGPSLCPTQMQSTEGQSYNNESLLRATR